MIATRINNPVSRLYQLLTTAWRNETGASPDLNQVIERIRQRWRLRLLLNGLFWTLGLGLAVFIVSALLLNHWHFSSGAVWTFRVLGFCAWLGLIFQFCVKPLRRQVSDTRVALYLEEHEPALKSIMLSAVDARQTTARNLSPQLVQRLVEQALAACRRVEFGDAIEQRRLYHTEARLGLALLVIASLWLWPPAALRDAAPALLMPWTDASEYSPYRIELSPGDIEIARGGDQLVSARIAGFDGDDVFLFTSTDNGASWQQSTMAMSGGASLYESFLFDLDRAVDYYVSGAGQQSETFRIGVADIPAISEISLRYHYPAYTMLEPESTTGSGDISALRGTRVEVQIEPTIDIPGGELLLNDGRRIPLVQNEAQLWSADIVVEESGGYRVELQRASGIPVPASPEFRITALDDKYPSVSILSPGRDTKVSMIEEPVMTVRASDDQGIARLELVMSINGASEQKIQLAPALDEAGANQRVEAEHTVYLEDLELRPGDLISYYVHAEDLAPSAKPRTATSDIFFYQVRPFSKNYRRADQQGGGGGGAQGGQQDGFLSEQQKQFVIATFKMIRDRENYDDEAYRENLDLLARAESRIRDRVEAIVRRIGSRSIVRADEQYRIVMEELPKAARVMIEVEKQLKAAEVEQALSDAQVALQHLQRADAAFRDINVSLANRNGSGSGNSAGFEDLANLFRLEMDKLRHQYDTVQHGQQQATPEQVIDETLERLRELARRQQKEVERWMRRQDQAQNNGDNERQLALARELEEMARQLERLSREQPNSRLQQSINQMRDAAEAMRRAAGNGGGGIGQARQAADNLREARRLLDQSRVAQFSEEVERTLRRAELVEKKQAAIKQEVAQLDDNWGDKLKQQLNRLQDRKQELTEELSRLEGELSDLTAAAREDQPQAGQSLKQAIRTSREFRLHDRIGRTRQMVLLEDRKHAIDNETEIQKGITRIRGHIESALDNVSQQSERGLARSLESMRSLASELQTLRDRAAPDPANQGAEADSPGQAGNGYDQATRQELQGIAARAGGLWERLRSYGVGAGDIDPVLEKINQLAQSQKDSEIPASELHDLTLEALKDLEFRLRTQLDGPQAPELLVTGSDELPDDYRDLVADYFRELSEQ